jgi:C4-dicarboxylate-specific signal transduction histidine kinase
MAQDTEAKPVTPLEQLAQIMEEHKDRATEIEIPVPQKLMEQITAEFRDLQAAQRQLMQSENMVMLGQLMAGIAHEISTPIALSR